MEQLKRQILRVERIDLAETARRLRGPFPIFALAAETPFRKASPSILEHTQEVLDSLRKAPPEEHHGDSPLMTPWWDFMPALYAAALFHDFGRINTEQSAAIAASSRSHPTHGASIARDVMFRLGIPFEVREHAVSLVRNHTVLERYERLGVKDEKILALSCRLDTSALYHMRKQHFATLGGAYSRERIELLESFRARATALNVFGALPTVPVTEADLDEFGILSFRDRFTAMNMLRYFRIVEGMRDPQWHRERLRELSSMLGRRLIIVAGPAGSGKSVWIAGNRAALRVVSTDKMREEFTGDASSQQMNRIIFPRAMERLRRILAKDETAVFDATNLTESSRALPLKSARWSNAGVTACYFDVPLSTCKDRNRRRARVVPDRVIEKQFKSLSVPGIHECDELIVVSENGSSDRYWPVP